MKYLVFLAAAPLLYGCATQEPFPASIEAGVQQISENEPNCFDYNKYLEDGVYLETYCGGYYPPSLSMNGVEARCGALFDLLPDGSIKLYDVACNVGRDSIARNYFGDISSEEVAIAKPMFEASTKAAIDKFVFRLEGERASIGRTNLLFPIDFALSNGVADAADPTVNFEAPETASEINIRQK